MKRCPYCAEEIQEDATVCRWCGRDLYLRKTIWKVVIGIIVVGIIGLGAIVYFGMPLFEQLMIPSDPVVITATAKKEPTNTRYPTAYVTAKVITKTPAPGVVPALNVSDMPGSKLLGSSDNKYSEVDEIIKGHAKNLALEEPYRWGLYELEKSTRFADVEAYFNKELVARNYTMTLSEQGMDEIYLLKFTRGDNRITVQYWGLPDADPPSMLIIEEY